MLRKIQIGSIAALLLAAIATMMLVVRDYRRNRDASRLLYTRAVKKHDIIDAARNALAALSDAEIREQNYVLTGETVYSEAYANDVRTWADEFAALELEAKNDPATPLVQDLSKAGTQTLGELAVVVSLYEKSGREPAVERIRKGSGTVYLDKARDSVAKILEVDGVGAEGSTPIVNRALSSLRRLWEEATVLFALTVVSTVFLILGIRRKPVDQ